MAHGHAPTPAPSHAPAKAAPAPAAHHPGGAPAPAPAAHAALKSMPFHQAEALLAPGGAPGKHAPATPHHEPGGPAHPAAHAPVAHAAAHAPAAHAPAAHAPAAHAAAAHAPLAHAAAAHAPHAAAHAPLAHGAHAPHAAAAHAPAAHAAAVPKAGHAAHGHAAAAPHKKEATGHLTPHQVEAAIAYDRGRGFKPARWKAIQRTVGTPADGAVGPHTVQAVAAWQAHHGLVADGMVGPHTLSKLEAAGAHEQPPSHGGGSHPGPSHGGGHGGGDHHKDPWDLTQAQIHKAIQYNNEQALSRDQIKKIQRETGAGVDGGMGPDTVRHIAKFQAHHGLDIDGEVGPRTAKALGIHRHHQGGTVATGGAAGHLNEKIYHTAMAWYGHDTYAGPDHGVNACAWIVNKVLNAAIGRTFGTNTNLVSSVEADLEHHADRIDGPGHAKRGDIVIVPASHIGICIGGQVLSNSSSRHAFKWISDFSFSPSYHQGVGHIWRIRG
ncbi:MAG: peptidoglycan-binding protein [Myxococcota bacterium]